MIPRISRFGALIGLLTLLAGCQTMASANMQATSDPEPPPEAVSSQVDLARIQHFMDAAVEQGRIPSSIAMIARDDELLFLETAGEMGPGVPMQRDAIIPLASLGKMYTATAAMILVERGVIALDDPVSRFIPEFADSMAGEVDQDGDVSLVPLAAPVTVRHLLTHTGGLYVRGNSYWDVWNVHAGETTTTDFARALAALPFASQPGTSFDYGYTGGSYEVLAAVIEIASGQTLEALMAENIFEPLGLEDTYFYIPVEKQDRLPAFYRIVDGALELDRARGDENPRTTYFFGGGGVKSSAHDIQRFARLFLNGGSIDGVQILRAETVSMMMTDQLGEIVAFDGRSGWGFGAGVQSNTSDGVSGTSTYGWDGGGYAVLWVDPELELIAYFIAPLSSPGDYELLAEYRQLVDELFEE